MKIHGTSNRTSGRSLPAMNLSSPGVQAGLWVNYRDPAVIETLAAENFDWICVDGQHGYAEPGDYRALFEAAHAFGVPAAVRVAGHDLGSLGRAIDAGARALIIPTVEDAGQARTLLEACRFAPRGKRSFGPTRLTPRYPIGICADPSNDPLVILMIETARGLENLDEILSTEPDGIFVGPYDLALSLGMGLEELTRGAKRHLLQEIALRCHEDRVAPGIFAGEVELAGELASLGFTFMPIASDSSLAAIAAANALKRSAGFRTERPEPQGSI